MALPGVLPVLNKGAVERAIKFGLSVNAKINSPSVFARKNYFYPDLPKGYRFSQFELPIVQGGSICMQVNGVEKNIRLTRAHLEEDAGKSLHEDFHGMTGLIEPRWNTIVGNCFRSPICAVVLKPLRTLKHCIRWCVGSYL